MKTLLALRALAPVVVATLALSAFAESNSSNPTTGATVPLIARGAVWKYWNHLEAPPAAWKEAAFDDAQWASGPAQLGYGDGDEATVMFANVAGSRRPVTAHFRKRFEVAHAAAVANLVMKILRDDGAVVYLNGVEVYRNNMPDGAVDGQTLALTSINQDAEKLYVAGLLPANRLVDGVNVLAVEIHQVVAGSADLSFDLELAGNAAPAGDAQTLIPKGSLWKYLDNGSDQGTAWVAPGFDDSAWKSGFGPLGYANDNEATIVSYGPDPEHKYITTYFRKTFTVANPAAISNLQVRVMRDDGAATYLNGVQITRGNLAAGATYLTRARSNYGPPAETKYYTANVNPALLVAGENVLAAEVHQYSGGSVDLSFDLELVTSNGAPNVPPVVVLTRPAAQETFTAPAEIALAAEVRTGSSEVLWVEFFANGQLVGRDTTAPYTATWSQVPAGTYQVQAIATDARRNTAASPAATIVVGPAANLPPVVSLITPQNGAGFAAPATIELAASAADPDGAIAGVEFFAGDTSLGPGELTPNSAGAAPVYRLVWAGVAAGEYRVTARATDNLGAHATSAGVTVKVIAASGKPVVTVSSTNRIAMEGSDDVAEFIITRLGGDLSAPLTVAYAMSGSAENGVDYTALPGIVTIPAGEASATVVIQALADTANEYGEPVILTLVADPGGAYVVGAESSAIGAVVEAPPSLPGGQLAAASVAPGFTPVLHSLRVLANGECRMIIISEPGKPVMVEASTDLEDWNTIATLPNPEGVLEFTDPSAPNFRQTFYRVFVE